MDKRDLLTWVAIELTKYGEVKVEEGLLEALLRQDLGVDSDFPVFIPATSYNRDNHRTTLHLMEGYAFVASGLPEVRYFALEKEPYVERVLSSESGKHGLRALYALSNDHIENLRLQLRQMVISDVEMGTRVLVKDGTYKGLDGVVQGVEGEFAFVDISLRSLNVVATIPRAFLEVLPDAA